VVYDLAFRQTTNHLNRNVVMFIEAWLKETELYLKD